MESVTKTPKALSAVTKPDVPMVRPALKKTERKANVPKLAVTVTQTVVLPPVSSLETTVALSNPPAIQQQANVFPAPKWIAMPNAPA